MLQLTAVAGHEGRLGRHPNGWKRWNPGLWNGRVLRQGSRRRQARVRRVQGRRGWGQQLGMRGRPGWQGQRPWPWGRRHGRQRSQRERRGRNEAAVWRCAGCAGQTGDDASLGLLRTTVTGGRVLDCVHPGNRVVARFGVGQDGYARGDRRGTRTRATRDRASGARNGIGSTNRGLC